MGAQSDRAAEAVHRLERDLEKRSRELNCLYAISAVVEKQHITLGQIFQETVELLPPAWQHPGVAGARIVFEDVEHATGTFRQTEWRQAAGIVVGGAALGSVEVCYLQERPKSDEGPFLHEERSLLNAIAERLGKIATRKRAEAASAQRRAALESVYRIAAEPTESLEAMCEQVVQDLAQLLTIASVAVCPAGEGELQRTSRIVDGVLVHESVESRACRACDLVGSERRVYQHTGSLRERFSECLCSHEHDFRCYLAVPMTDREGRLLGVVCALDYGERVLGEDEIHVVEIFARYIAKEMERARIERDLQQSQRLKVLGQLASGVAHEVRNPLSAILAMTGALEASLGGTREYGLYFDRINAQVTRLSDLMRDLLDLGKPLQRSRMEPCAMPRICSGAVEVWRQPAQERTHAVRLTQSPRARDAVVIGDVTKLQQVLVNLLDNAAQHSPDGAEIVLSILAPLSGTVRVRVRDHGTGVAPAELPQVFEPFFTTRRKGTGLGLSLVKSIVEGHEGSVRIWNNRPPPGCTVEVALPTAEEAL